MFMYMLLDNVMMVLIWDYPSTSLMIFPSCAHTSVTAMLSSISETTTIL
jgi:hypothetical protein